MAIKREQRKRLSLNKMNKMKKMVIFLLVFLNAGFVGLTAWNLNHTSRRLEQISIEMANYTTSMTSYEKEIQESINRLERTITEQNTALANMIVEIGDSREVRHVTINNTLTPEQINEIREGIARDTREIFRDEGFKQVVDHWNQTAEILNRRAR